MSRSFRRRRPALAPSDAGAVAELVIAYERSLYGETDAFRKFRDPGEPSAGLGVDAENPTGAFQLHESAGMRPVMGWLMHEKNLAG